MLLNGETEVPSLSDTSAVYLSHALSLQLNPFGALLILTIGLASAAFVASLVVVVPRIARVLLGKPRPDVVRLPLGRRRLLAPVVVLGCAGPLTEGVGLIAGNALMSDTGLVLTLVAIFLLLVAYR